jgi:hypothetical protein
MFGSSLPPVDEVAVRLAAADLAIASARRVLAGHRAPDGSALPARTGVRLEPIARSAGIGSIIDSQNTDIVEGVPSRPQ